MAKPNTAISSERALCSRCHELDFDAIFSSEESLGPRGALVVELGELSLIQDGAYCALCEFFHACLPVVEHEDEKGPPYQLRLFAANNRFKNERDELTGGSVPESRFLQIVPEKWAANRGRRFVASRHTTPVAILPTLRSAPQRRLNHKDQYAGIEIGLVATDYSQIRFWLDTCSTSHSLCAQTRAPGLVTGMKVIDCMSMQIVGLSHGQRYFALSYVWGSSSPQSRGESQNTQSKFPQVVEDAILVVNKLKERYLWVDKYCIDEEDRQRQIESMDLIYEGAYATLVSTAPDDVSGMPGVSVNIRSPQPVVKIGNTTLVSALNPDVSSQIAETTWMSRGWTFQELHLSRRCIVFTNLQILCICRSGTKSETEHLQQGLIRPWPKIPQGQSIWKVGRPSGGDLASNINTYTQRDLTFESDILNALRGILARSNLYSYWGVPVFNGARSLLNSFPEEINGAFQRGLAWSITRKHDCLQDMCVGRRPGFPSWSWAGWKGKISFPYRHPIHEQENNLDVDGFWWPKIWLEAKDGSLMLLFEAISADPYARVVYEHSHYIHIEAPIVRVRFKVWKHPISKGFDLLLAYMARSPPPIPEHLEYGNYLTGEGMGNYGRVEWSSQEDLSSMSESQVESLEEEGIDGIVLWKEESTYIKPYCHYFVLLVKKKGAFVERVGAVTFESHKADFDLERATFRIG